MSFASWKAEFYPIPAEKVSAEDALAHSLKKWEGALPEALRAHGLIYENHRLYDAQMRTYRMQFDGATCALCVHHWSGHGIGVEDDCGYCPVHLAGANCNQGSSVYFQSRHDPQPMVDLLRSLTSPAVSTAANANEVLSLGGS